MTSGLRIVSCGAPSASSLPWSSTATRSASATTARITCSTKTMVVPPARILRIRSTAWSTSDGVKPAQHLVEQQQLRARGQRPREFDELALVQIQRGRQLVRLVGQAGEGQPVPRLRFADPVAPRRPLAPERGTQPHVLEHRHVLEQAGDLVGARDPLAGNLVRLERPRCACPSSTMLPEVSGKCPLIMLMSVDLPEPLGPTSARISPRRMSSVTPPSACRSAEALGHVAALEQRPAVGVPTGSSDGPRRGQRQRTGLITLATRLRLAQARQQAGA